ncbi:MAG: CDP-alcohol phosphatidyltransferase family protein [Acidimicrobiia bacterium]|jgi:cardiolipin synthase (CMP-forming)
MLSDALTVPNAVSFVRLLAVPYFWYVLLVQENVGLAAVLIFVIGGTDWVDGYLARRLDQVSKVGAFLDPLADRLMIASAIVAGMIAGVLPPVIGIPLILREVAVGLGALVYAGRGGTIEVRYLGKTATFLLYGALPSFYLTAAGLAAWLFAPAAWLVGVVGLILYYWVASLYLGDLRGRPSG